MLPCCLVVCVGCLLFAGEDAGVVQLAAAPKVPLLRSAQGGPGHHPAHSSGPLSNSVRPPTAVTAGRTYFVFLYIMICMHMYAAFTYYMEMQSARLAAQLRPCRSSSFRRAWCRQLAGEVIPR